MDIDIRECTALDLSDGLLDTLSNLADVGLTAEKARALFRARLRAGVRTYVAVADGKVVGTTTVLVEQKLIHDGGLVAHIEDVAVHRDHQQRGIASALVQYAIDEARKAGCYKVILSCYEKLVPFYERLGFRRHDVGMRLDVKNEE